MSGTPEHLSPKEKPLPKLPPRPKALNSSSGLSTGKPRASSAVGTPLRSASTKEHKKDNWGTPLASYQRPGSAGATFDQKTGDTEYANAMNDITSRLHPYSADTKRFASPTDGRSHSPLDVRSTRSHDRYIRTPRSETFPIDSPLRPPVSRPPVSLIRTPTNIGTSRPLAVRKPVERTISTGSLLPRPRSHNPKPGAGTPLPRVGDDHESMFAGETESSSGSSTGSGNRIPITLDTTAAGTLNFRTDHGLGSDNTRLLDVKASLTRSEASRRMFEAVRNGRTKRSTKARVKLQPSGGCAATTESSPVPESLSSGTEEAFVFGSSNEPAAFDIFEEPIVAKRSKKSDPTSLSSVDTILEGEESTATITPPSSNEQCPYPAIMSQQDMEMSHSHGAAASECPTSSGSLSCSRPGAIPKIRDSAERVTMSQSMGARSASGSFSGPFKRVSRELKSAPECTKSDSRKAPSPLGNPFQSDVTRSIGRRISSGKPQAKLSEQLASFQKDADQPREESGQYAQNIGPSEESFSNLSEGQWMASNDSTSSINKRNSCARMSMVSPTGSERGVATTKEIVYEEVESGEARCPTPDEPLTSQTDKERERDLKRAQFPPRTSSLKPPKGIGLRVPRAPTVFSDRLDEEFSKRQDRLGAKAGCGSNQIQLGQGTIKRQLRSEDATSRSPQIPTSTIEAVHRSRSTKSTFGRLFKRSSRDVMPRSSGTAVVPTAPIAQKVKSPIPSKEQTPSLQTPVDETPAPITTTDVELSSSAIAIISQACRVTNEEDKNLLLEMSKIMVNTIRIASEATKAATEAANYARVSDIGRTQETE